MGLKCPRDGSELTIGREHGVEIDRCPRCQGAWYENEELVELEATVSDEEHRLGTIEYAKRTSDLTCPVCGDTMRAFNYRAHSLEMDACHNEHGFWLDAGESAHVREVMKERVWGLRRARSAQRGWNRLRGRGRSGVLDQIRDLFRGR